jgi:hypothetical protein
MNVSAQKPAPNKCACEITDDRSKKCQSKALETPNGGSHLVECDCKCQETKTNSSECQPKNEVRITDPLLCAESQIPSKNLRSISEACGVIESRSECSIADSCVSFQLCSECETRLKAARLGQHKADASSQASLKPLNKASIHPPSISVSQISTQTPTRSSSHKCGSPLVTDKSSSVSMKICFKCIQKESSQPSQAKSDKSNEACLIQKVINSNNKLSKELCSKLKQAEEFLLRLAEERERLDEKACQLKLCRCCRSADNQTDDDEKFCRNLDAIKTVDGMIRSKIDGIKSIKQQVKALQEEIDAIKKC